MGPIGAILGASIFTVLLGSHLSVSRAALIGGAVPIVLSGLALLGARHIKPGQTLEGIAV
jgi:hypothetical protein